MKTMEKYIDICSAIGGMERVGIRKEPVEKISDELKGASARLDNLLYEIYGMSGTDMLDTCTRGHMISYNK